MKKYFGSVLLHPHDPKVIFTACFRWAAEQRENESSIYKSTGRRREFQRDRHRRFARSISSDGTVWRWTRWTPSSLYFGAADGKLITALTAVKAGAKLDVELPSEGRIRTDCMRALIPRRHSG